MKSAINIRSLTLAVVFAALASLATAFSSIVSTTTMSGPGVPAISCSATSANLGRIYVRNDAKAQFSSLYTCVQYADGKFRWEGPYGPNLLVSEPNTPKIHSVTATPTGIDIR